MVSTSAQLAKSALDIEKDEILKQIENKSANDA